MHKESNQRNAPSVTRRPQAAGSLRSAGVWRQGSCPVAKCAPSLARPAYGVRGLFQPTFAASQRDPRSRAKLKASAAGTAALCFTRVPPGRGEQVEDQSRSDRRQEGGEFADSTWTYCRQTPEPARVVAGAWMPLRPRPRGCISLVTFFVQAKKVTRPPGMAGEARQGRTSRQCDTRRKAKALGPRLRGDGE